MPDWLVEIDVTQVVLPANISSGFSLGRRFRLLYSDQSWTSVSWEQVIAADLQCIIIDNSYGTPTAAQKEKILETSKFTRNLRAVKNKCFLPGNYDEVTPGPRSAEAVVQFARWLHPSTYGLPADGS